MVPTSRYTSPEFAQLELQKMWPRVWQIACSVDHVAEPGDYYEYRCGPYSVLIVRGDDGELRAFQNVCRHRGNLLCEGVGDGLTELRCGYHNWTWDLKGRLREVPSRKGFGVAAQRRLPALRGAGRHVGPHRVRQPRPRRDAARRVPRGGARRHRVGRLRRLPLRDGRDGAGRGELEGRLRRLQRDVPRAGPAPRDDRLDGRHRRAAGGVGPHEQVVAALRRRQPALPQRSRRPDGLGVVHRHPGRAHGRRGGVPDARARAGPDAAGRHRRRHQARAGRAGRRPVALHHRRDAAPAPVQPVPELDGARHARPAVGDLRPPGRRRPTRPRW